MAPFLTIIAMVIASPTAIAVFKLVPLEKATLSVQLVELLLVYICTQPDAI